ncbi:uncharacterized protein LOC144440452 [Glandiceps talaboti]
MGFIAAIVFMVILPLVVCTLVLVVSAISLSETTGTADAELTEQALQVTIMITAFIGILANIAVLSFYIYMCLKRRQIEPKSIDVVEGDTPNSECSTPSPSRIFSMS